MFTPTVSSSFGLTNFNLASVYEKPPEKDARISIHDEIIINRLNHLAQQSKRRPFEYQAAFVLPLKDMGKKSVTLSFFFNVDRFLTHCKEKLNKAGFHTADEIQFKGGALHFVLDGHPKELHDFDVSLKIESPKDPKDWQKIHEIILICMEEEAGLIRYENKEEGFVVYQQKESPFNIEMALEEDSHGNIRRFLFQHPETINNVWCASDFFRKMNEEYLLYQIPTMMLDKSCPIEIEIVARHKNSATCSLDALRVDYPLKKLEAVHFSAVDGYDVRHILELRERGLFDVQLERIPTIRLGFLRYNATLMKGYLPTLLTFEQAYGEHLEKNESAVKDLEKNLEKFLNDHYASLEKKILYLLISYGTSTRLNISDHVKQRLQVLYGQTLCNVLGEKSINSELVQNASLFLSLYFDSFSKELMPKERPMSHQYAKGQLLRLFGSKGKRGSAFVLETSSLPSKETAQEQLRKILTQSPTLVKIIKIFVPDDFERAKILGEKIERTTLEQPRTDAPSNFEMFLEKVDLNSKVVKKQAKLLLRLFSLKSETLILLTKEQKLKLSTTTKEIILALKSIDKSLAAALLNEVYSHRIFSLEQRENLLKELVEILLQSPYELKDAQNLCETALEDLEISFETLETLFTHLVNSPNNLKSTLLIFSRINFKSDKLPELLIIWETILEKICGTPVSHQLIVNFWHLFSKFANECYESNVEGSLKLGWKQILSMTFKILVELEKDALVWAYEIHKAADTRFLKEVKEACLDLIEKAVEQESPNVIPLYLHCQFEFMNEDSKDRFLKFFSVFVTAASRITDQIEICDAIARGLRFFVHKTLPIQNGKDILHKLKTLPQYKDFPDHLKSAMEKLEEYCQPKKSKFSAEGFKSAVGDFITKPNDDNFDEAIGLFRILIPEIKNEVSLLALYSLGLQLFEEGFRQLSKTAKFVDLLNTLAALLRYKGWTADQKERYGKCLMNLSKIPKISSEKETKQAAKPELKSSLPKIEKDLSLQVKKILSCNDKQIANLERLLKKYPEDSKVWFKLFKLYFFEKDHKNIILSGKNFILHCPQASKKFEVLVTIGSSFIVIGELEQAIPFFQQALTVKPKDYEVQYLLGVAYIDNQDWTEALKILKPLKGFTAPNLKLKASMERSLLIAELCKVAKFREAIELLKHADEGMDYCRSFLIGELCYKIKEFGKAIPYFLKAFSYCSTKLDVIMRLGQTYLEVGNIQSANAFLEKARYHPNCNIDIKNKIALSYFNSSQWRYAAMEFSIIAYNHPSSISINDFLKFEFAILNYINNDHANITEVRNFKSGLTALYDKRLFRYEDLLYEKEELFEIKHNISAEKFLGCEKSFKHSIMELFYDISDRCCEHKEWILAIKALTQYRFPPVSDSKFIYWVEKFFKIFAKISKEFIDKALVSERVTIIQPLLEQQFAQFTPEIISKMPSEIQEKMKSFQKSLKFKE
jgi:tetratricopeptide (TPR) repeat protein